MKTTDNDYVPFKNKKRAVPALFMPASDSPAAGECHAIRIY